MPKIAFGYGEAEAVIAHEPGGFGGRGAITLAIEDVIKLRLTLEDAESVGEKLIECVRRAERNTPAK